MVITGIATQGYGNSSAEEWVSMYMMLYEKGDGLPFFTEIDGESLKVGVTMLFLLNLPLLLPYLALSVQKKKNGNCKAQMAFADLHPGKL